MRNAVGVRCSLSGPCAGVKDWPMLLSDSGREDLRYDKTDKTLANPPVGVR